MTVSDFAQRLDMLMTAIVGPDGRALSNAAVVKGLKDAGVTDISNSYFSELRIGKKTAPRLPLIHALADYFGVDPCYFVTTNQDVIATTIAEIGAANELNRAGLMEYAPRVSGDLSPEQLTAIQAAVQATIRAERRSEHE